MLLNKLNQEVEQPIDPPEHSEWSQREIDAAIAKLVENIEDGADWDEDDEYSQDLFEQILAIHFSKSIAFDDKAFDIRTAIAASISRCDHSACSGGSIGCSTSWFNLFVIIIYPIIN